MESYTSQSRSGRENPGQTALAAAGASRIRTTARSAIDAGVCVQPVALRYPRPDGSADPAAAFVDDMTFVESLGRVLRAGALRAELTFGPSLATSGRTRRELAEASRAFVVRTLGLPAGAVEPMPPWRRRRFRLAG